MDKYFRVPVLRIFHESQKEFCKVTNCPAGFRIANIAAPAAKGMQNKIH